ncbi:hypothetical protein HRbin22_01052 [Candidatus Thermoflexus japonica]|uniref:DUF5666 domain-containing protein n=1 Tax=Candidatus Thermoflexus japonica TaxID=2035417 RepID=A0A2H5Y5U1_9CHLR|nr:hypothetical protein HRbin22_01052 [Candidatus Thermoflexus japonica]
MTRITRRQFLRNIALGSGALASQIVFEPARMLTGSEDQSVGDGTIFLEGDIIAVDPDRGMLVINERGGAPVNLRVSSSTRIWKGEVTDLTALELGDFLYLRALPGLDGTFTATKIWANIVNLMGTVSAVENGGFQLRIDGHAHEGPERPITVRFHPSLVVNDNPTVTPALRVGQSVQVLGVIERDGVLKATRMWVAE